MQLMIIAAIFVGIGAVAFAMQNNLPVTVNFLLWRFDSSLAMVLLLALATGAIVVALLTTPGTLRRQWQLARQRRQLDELEKRCEAQRTAICRPGFAFAILRMLEGYRMHNIALYNPLWFDLGDSIDNLQSGIFYEPRC